MACEESRGEQAVGIIAAEPGAQPAMPCRTVGRWSAAGEESPTSGKRSEVIGPRDSPNDAEERAGSEESINSKRAKARSFLRGVVD